MPLTVGSTSILSGLELIQGKVSVSVSVGTTSVGTDPAGNRVPLQTMRPVGARIADDAVNVCDVVAHTRWTVSTASTGGSVLTFGV